MEQSYRDEPRKLDECVSNEVSPVGRSVAKRNGLLMKTCTANGFMTVTTTAALNDQEVRAAAEITTQFVLGTSGSGCFATTAFIDCTAAMSRARRSALITSITNSLRKI